MIKVDYNIIIGSNSISSSNAGLLISVETNVSLNIPINSCYIKLYNNNEIEINTGDMVTVELGYDGSLTTVFTGIVNSCNYEIEEITVEVFSGFSSLLSSRFNILYEGQNSSDIISDVLGMVDIQTDMIEPGATLSVYAISDSENLYDNLKSISMKNGQDFYANHEDKAVSKMFIPGEPHFVKYGSNIISFSMIKGSDYATGVEIYGESPVGQGQSDEAAPWFTKSDVKGSAGDTTGYVLRVQDPSARDMNNAQSFAQNIMDSVRVKDRVEARLTGMPELLICDVVMVSEMPVSSYNSMYKIISVQHMVDNSAGYVSDIIMESIS